MKILADTSVWSLAFRRKTPNAVSDKLAELILASQIVLIGPIRQELLSGISDNLLFSRLRTMLEPFDDLQVVTADYETAAQFYNICHSHGIQGSHIDFLICAVAANNNLFIFTTDQDFERFAKYLPIRLFTLDTQ